MGIKSVPRNKNDQITAADNTDPAAAQKPLR